MRKTSVALLGQIILTLAIMGCSVKEERLECPCTLMLDFSQVDAAKVDSLRLSVCSSSDFLHKKIVESALYEDIYLVSVPKTTTWINVYASLRGEDDFENYLSSSWSSLNILLGNQCPRVHMFSKQLDLGAYDDQVEVPVTLHKNYSEITIYLYAQQEVDFSLAVVGSISGYDITGSPVSGSFRYEPPYEDGALYRTCVPRQVDSSLILEVFDEDEVLRDFAIGEYIIESGFDWTDADLADIEMTINYSKTSVSFIMMGWTKVIELEVVI